VVGARGGKESASFEYDKSWLENPLRFSLEPALQLGLHQLLYVSLSPRYHFQRLHVTRNLISKLVLGHFQIVAGLEIHPECRRVLEVAGASSRNQGCGLLRWPFSTLPISRTLP
jgi:hypothetical protein